jgi:hypothetical protein
MRYYFLKRGYIVVLFGCAGWLGNQTWFTAEDLVDEIVEPPRLMRSPAEVQLPAVCNGPTEDERFVQAMLTGLGKVQVWDKAAFGRELAAWFNRNVKGASQPFTSTEC